MLPELGQVSLILALLIAAQGRPIRFTSFEAFPMTATDIARALAAFPEAEAVAAPFLAAWGAGRRRFTLGAMEVEVIEGDALDYVTDVGHRASADVLCVDLYDHEAASPVLDSARFYRACFDLLADGGGELVETPEHPHVTLPLVRWPYA